MRPVLVPIPSKLLFIAALLLAVGSLVWNLVRRRRDPSVPFSLTPILLVICAGLIVHFKSGAGGWLPTGGAWGRQWDPVPVHSYGVMLGTSLIVGWFLAMRLAKQDGIPQEDAGTIYMWTAVWSVIGSRILWYITDPPENGSIFDIFKVWQGGLVAYGGMIGGFLASWYGCWKRKIPLLRWADVAAPSVVLGTGITRIGCLLFGCDYGAVSKVRWAIAFPKGSPAWHHHVNDLGLSRAAEWSYRVHPTQIYESLAGFFLFGVLMLIRRYRRFSGQVFLGWVFGYGILRPLIEVVRDDSDRGVYSLPLVHLSLSTSQIIGIVSVLLGIVLLVYLMRRYRRDPEGLRLWQQPLVAPVPAAAAPAPGARKRRKRR